MILADAVSAAVYPTNRNIWVIKSGILTIYRLSLYIMLTAINIYIQ